MEKYGVDARDWDNSACFHIKARLLLLDHDGREVWKGNVDKREKVTSSWFAVGSPATDVWTGRTLGELTVAQVTLALNAIADHSAFHLTEKLRTSLEKARD